VDEWRDSGYAQNNPGRWLDKIRYVRRHMNSATQSYGEFLDQNGKNEMMESACGFVMHCTTMKEYDQMEDDLKKEIVQELMGFYSDQEDEDEEYDEEKDQIDL
jgi:hypothetical protein